MTGKKNVSILFIYQLPNMVLDIYYVLINEFLLKSRELDYRRKVRRRKWHRKKVPIKGTAMRTHKAVTKSVQGSQPTSFSECLT